jgi:cellulose synthase (UDP-forming)
MVFYQLPVFLSFFLAMRWLVGGHFSPLVSGPVGLFSSFRLGPTVVASLIKPFGKPFKVTPKGSDAANGRQVDFFSLGMILGCMALTLMGLLLNVVPELAVVSHDEFFPIAMFWSMLNVVTLGLAALLCFEGPRLLKRGSPTMASPTTRFKSSMPVSMGANWPCHKQAVPFSKKERPA